eukprot:752250-Hanusia_phi.AAC.1
MEGMGREGKSRKGREAGDETRRDETRRGERENEKGGSRECVQDSMQQDKRTTAADSSQSLMKMMYKMLGVDRWALLLLRSCPASPPPSPPPPPLAPPALLTITERRRRRRRRRWWWWWILDVDGEVCWRARDPERGGEESSGAGESSEDVEGRSDLDAQGGARQGSPCCLARAKRRRRRDERQFDMEVTTAGAQQVRNLEGQGQGQEQGQGQGQQEEQKEQEQELGAAGRGERCERGVDMTVCLLRAINKEGIELDACKEARGVAEEDADFFGGRAPSEEERNLCFAILSEKKKVVFEAPDKVMLPSISHRN